MKQIYNSIIPFKGFVAINICGIMFVRKEYKGKIGWRTINHESIHTAQMKELGYVFFYLIYLFEWLYWLIADTKNAYHRVSFEREAYKHQSDYTYLISRKHYAEWRSGKD